MKAGNYDNTFSSEQGYVFLKTENMKQVKPVTVQVAQNVPTVV